MRLRSRELLTIRGMAAVLVVWVGAPGCLVPARADIVFSDHFTGSTLDPAWVESLSGATGWTYSLPTLSGTHLQIEDIAGVATDTWGYVYLKRQFAPLSDCTIQFDFAWDSAGRRDAMQYVRLLLYSSGDTSVIDVGHCDAWVGYSGSRSATIAGTSYTPQKGSMPLSGSASVVISRVGPQVDITWDGAALLSGQCADLIRSVTLLSCYYNYSLGSTYGSESVDLLSVEGVVMPEPLTPGDANGDGKVDDLDASILAAHWQQTGGATWAQADFNSDGNVDELDASILAANWQYGVGATVPEPSILLGLATLLAAGGVLGRRRGLLRHEV